jgi:hypothetical protein
MSTPNPFISAAAPELIAILNAVKQLMANLGTDPLQVVAKFPGASQVFMGTVLMQFPALASAEFGAVQTGVTAQIDGLIAKLQAQTPAA